MAFPAVQQALTTDLLTVVGSAAAFGVVSHVSLFRILPVEKFLYSLFGVYAAALVALTTAYLSLTELGALNVIFRVGCISSALNTGLAASIAVYRLFFHRLHRFPGPWLSKLSRFYDAYLAGKDVQYHEEIARMHEKYSNFIRIRPREIYIVRRSAVPLLLSPQSKCAKSTFHTQAQMDSRYCNVHHTRDFDDHRRRQKAWDRGFSIKALASYEPNVRGKVDLLISHLEKTQGQAIDITTWAMFLSFNIMGNVGFRKEFNNLSTSIEHPGIKAVHDHMIILGLMGHILWLLNIITHLPGATSAMAEFFKWCEDEVVQKHKNWDINKHPHNVVSWLLKAYIEKDVSAAPSAMVLHDDSQVVLITGSETTAMTLALVVYFLCKNLDVLKKLQHLLDEAMPEGALERTYNKIKNISYLKDIIIEMLRLHPAILTGVYCVTPAKGLQVNKVYIPGNVNVFVPTQLIQTDKRYYINTKTFVPEQWNKKKEMVYKGALYSPFLYNESYPSAMTWTNIVGPYICPGKQLALMSLCTSISKLVQWYDISFAPGETGELFETKTLDMFTTTLPVVNVQFEAR